jgi:hypothetical protein
MAKNELLFRSVKVLDIGYITILYFLLAFAVTLLLKIIPFLGKDYDESKDKDKPLWQLVLESVLLIWIVGILAYFARNVVVAFPSPLNGLGGLDHSRVKELESSFVFVFVILFFNDPLVSKLKILYSRIVKK